VVTAPSSGSRPPNARRWRRRRDRAVLHHLRRTSAVGGEAGGGATAFSGAADSSVATHDAAPSDAITTDRAKATNPAPATRSTSGWGRPPKVRGGPRQEKRSPQSPGAFGSGMTSCKWSSQSFSFFHLPSGALTMSVI
jgi:hypothetical protein